MGMGMIYFIGFLLTGAFVGLACVVYYLHGRVTCLELASELQSKFISEIWNELKEIHENKVNWTNDNVIACNNEIMADTDLIHAPKTQPKPKTKRTYRKRIKNKD